MKHASKMQLCKFAPHFELCNQSASFITFLKFGRLTLHFLAALQLVRCFWLMASVVKKPIGLELSLPISPMSGAALLLSYATSDLEVVRVQVFLPHTLCHRSCHLQIPLEACDIPKILGGRDIHKILVHQHGDSRTGGPSRV